MELMAYIGYEYIISQCLSTFTFLPTKYIDYLQDKFSNYYPQNLLRKNQLESIYAPFHQIIAISNLYLT